MRKVILQQFATVDNFASGPNGEIDFIMSLQGKARSDIDRDSLEFIDSIDTILLGAVTYRLFADFWPTATTEVDPIADKLNSTAKVVFSRTLENAPWGKWDEAKVVSTDAADAVGRLKRVPGKDMVIWGSISLSHSLIREGLIDECQLRVMPVLLGKGRRVFPDDMDTINFELLGTKMYESGMVLLRYEPIK